MIKNYYELSQQALLNEDYEQLEQLLTAWQALPEDPHYFDYLKYREDLASFRTNTGTAADEALNLTTEAPVTLPEENPRETMIQMGLQGGGPVKLIVKGTVTAAASDNESLAEQDRTAALDHSSGKLAVISVVYVTLDPTAAEKQLRRLLAADPDSYYMVYGCPWDTDLEKLIHFPSVAITPEDFF